MHCITFAFWQCFMHYRCVFYIFEPCVPVRLDWAETMMHFSLHATWSCIVYAYIPFHFLCDTICWWCFSASLSLSLIVYTWHPSLKLLRPETLFGPGHYLLISLLYMSSSKMRKLVRTSRRTSPNMAFIQNATLSYRNSPILLYPLSFIVEVGNLYVRYSWVVPPWPYRIFTPICTVLILLCLNLLLLLEVHL